MHIVLINGSQRPVSQSSRITEYLAKQIAKLESGVTAEVISLKGNPLPLWEDENNSYKTSPALQKIWEPYQKKVQAADGFVFVSPEWHGMVPSGLKNFFLYCTPQDVGHKPALIVAVSGSTGGAYPVDELRISSYKNSRINYIPEHLIVRDANNMFQGDTPANKGDEYIRERADFALRNLLAYTKAMKAPRESGVLFDKRYGNGM